MNIHIWGPLAITFALGILFRFFARASQAFRSQLRTYPTRWSFVAANWDVFLLRTIPFNAGLFILWVFHPGLLSQGLSHVGVPDWVANWVTVPPTLGTSFGYGFFVDLGLDRLQMKLFSDSKFAWVPDVFKGEIPAYNPQYVNTEAFPPVPPPPEKEHPTDPAQIKEQGEVHEQAIKATTKD